MFEPGQHYRHRSMLDVYFKVQKLNKDDSLDVLWYNKQIGQYIYPVDTILIKFKDRSNYEFVHV